MRRNLDEQLVRGRDGQRRGSVSEPRRRVVAQRGPRRQHVTEVDGDDDQCVADCVHGVGRRRVEAHPERPPQRGPERVLGQRGGRGGVDGGSLATWPQLEAQERPLGMRVREGVEPEQLGQLESVFLEGSVPAGDDAHLAGSECPRRRSARRHGVPDTAPDQVVTRRYRGGRARAPPAPGLLDAEAPVHRHVDRAAVGKAPPIDDGARGEGAAIHNGRRRHAGSRGLHVLDDVRKDDEAHVGERQRHVGRRAARSKVDDVRPVRRPEQKRHPTDAA
jgi:hypothetical protein